MMERPKVVVNVRFEDDSSSDRLVNEQFEFELVGSHIQVRPLCPEDTKKSSPKKEKKNDAIRSRKIDDAKQKKKEKSSSKEKYDKQANSKEKSNKALVIQLSSKEKNEKEVTAKERDDKESTSKEKSEEGSSTKVTLHSSKNSKKRHVSRLEEFENDKKKFGPKLVAEISTWSVGGSSSNKMLDQVLPECGQIKYCLLDEDKDSSEDSESSDDDLKQKRSPGRKNQDVPIFSTNCDIDCFVEEEDEHKYGRRKKKERSQNRHDCHKHRSYKRAFDPLKKYEELIEESFKQFPSHKLIYDEENVGRKKHHCESEDYRRQKDRKIQRYRSRSHSPRHKDCACNGEGSYRIQERARSYSPKHKLEKEQSNVQAVTPDKKELGTKGKEKPKHKEEPEHLTKKKSHRKTGKQKHKKHYEECSETSTSESEESCDSGEGETKPRYHHKRKHHKKQRRKKHKGNDSRIEFCESSESSTSEAEASCDEKRGARYEDEDDKSMSSQDSTEELLNMLAARLYKRRLQIKVVRAFKRLLEQKRARERVYHTTKCNEENERRQRKRFEEDNRYGTYKIREARLPPTAKVSCAVRCCSKRDRMNDFYKASVMEEQTSTVITKPPAEKPKPPEEKPKPPEEEKKPTPEKKTKKDKSSSSLYDMGVRLSERRK